MQKKSPDAALNPSAEPSRSYRSASFAYPAWGILLALGAPGGFLLLRNLILGAPISFAWLIQELKTQSLTYGYLTVSTLLIFAALGHYLGRKDDDLLEDSITDSLTGLF